MDKIETKYLDKLAEYLNTFSSEIHFARTTEFAPLKKSIHYVKDKVPKKLIFLDLGCGIGNVLFTAKEILGKENKYVGVDLNAYYKGVVQNIDHEFSVLTVDIISEQTNELLKTADIVFAYRPMPNYKKVMKMYENINRYTKAGAFFLCNDTDIEPTLPNMKKLKLFEGIECCGQTDITIYQKLNN